MSRKQDGGDVLATAVAAVRARQAACDGCGWWPPVSVAWRVAEDRRSAPWWASQDMGPTEPCRVCGREPVVDWRIYRVNPNGWLEATSEPSPSADLVQAGANAWVSAFAAYCTEAAQEDELNDQDEGASDDYDVRYWAMYRGPADRVPPEVLTRLVEVDAWWRVHPCGAPLPT